MNPHHYIDWQDFPGVKTKKLICTQVNPQKAMKGDNYNEDKWTQNYSSHYKYHAPPNTSGHRITVATTNSICSCLASLQFVVTTSFFKAHENVFHFTPQTPKDVYHIVNWYL